MSIEEIHSLYSDGAVYIPDEALLNALIEEGVDTNGDNLISFVEAEAITSLNVSGSPVSWGEISDMTGIEAFVHLETLDCSDHKIPSLDVTNNPHLNYLNCHNNLITSLDLRSNVHLVVLWTQENQLSSLDSIPTLQEVCVWTTPFPPPGVQVDTWQSPNIVYTKDCS